MGVTQEVILLLTARNTADATINALGRGLQGAQRDQRALSNAMATQQRLTDQMAISQRQLILLLTAVFARRVGRRGGIRPAGTLTRRSRVAFRRSRNRRNATRDRH